MTYSLSHIVTTVGPFLVDSMTYPVPITFPGTNDSVPFDFAINYAFLSICDAYVLTFSFIFVLLFVIFTAHTLTELNVMHQALEKVGDFEESKFLMELTTELKLNQKPKSEVLEPPVPKNERELNDELLNEIFEELEKDVTDTTVEEPVAGPRYTISQTEKIDEHFQAIYDILYENENYETNQEIDDIKSSLILRNVVIMHVDIIK